MDGFASRKQHGRTGTSTFGGRVSASTSRGGIATALSDKVRQVHQNEIVQAMTIARHNPLVKAVVEKILTDTIDCRFSLRLKYGDEFVELPESERKLVETRWKSFMRSALWHMQVVGFALVQRDAKTMTPRVIPLEYVHVMFRESATTPREYWVEDPGTGKSMEARVFVKYHPDPMGALTSPASTVMPHALRYERVLANQDEADYHRTHPVWAIETEKNGVGRPSSDEHDEFYEGEVMERYASMHAAIHSQEMTDFDELQRLALTGYKRTIERAQRNQTAPLPMGVEQEAPYLNNFFLPMNQHITNGPRPEINPHFTAELELLESKVLQAFRVPPMVMGTSHAVRYASQPENAMKQWGATVRGIQRDVALMVEETYMYVAAELFRAYAEAIIGDRVQRERVSAVQSLMKDNNRSGGERKRQKNEQDDAVEREGAKPPKVNAEGELQMPETEGSLRRAQAVLSVSNPEVMLFIQERFSVVAEFHCHPTAELEDVQKIYEIGLISRDTMAQQAAEIMGMAPEFFLIGEEAQVEDARLRKRLFDIENPPEQVTPPKKK